MIEIIVALIATSITGTIIEKRHYRSIRKREKILLQIPVLNQDMDVSNDDGIKHVELVGGSVVLGVDYFKKFTSSLKSLFGGSVSTIESLTDRARREAILRMRQKAINADSVINLRIETAKISDFKVEVFAYGTAVYLKDNDHKINSKSSLIFDRPKKSSFITRIIKLISVIAALYIILQFTLFLFANSLEKEMKDYLKMENKVEIFK